MHVYFSGIGGTGIGPLALIAKQAGFEVSGSDKQDSQYIEYLRKHGIEKIHIGQTTAAISNLHHSHPVDWYVYSSALPKENPEHPELVFVQASNIKHTRRDEFLNHVLDEKNLKMLAIAGTHGKTTTTALTVWLFKELGLPISYSVGAKISFGDMGSYDPASQYFVYECDEFDRNFLAFKPFLSLITGVTWDHHEIYKTRVDYENAFKDFIAQSHWAILWQDEAKRLKLENDQHCTVLDPADTHVDKIGLKGLYNRRDAWLAIQGVQELSKESLERLIGIASEFPGLSRRMEQIAPNLYSDYAHTPEKIKGAMSVALEMAAEKNQKVVVVYEPFTNRRMHYMKEQHGDVFEGASKIYWVPSYLAREDPEQPVLTPSELVNYLDPSLKAIAKPMEFDDQLEAVIRSHMQAGDMVVAMTGGGGHSLDEWLRERF